MIMEWLAGKLNYDVKEDFDRPIYKDVFWICLAMLYEVMAYCGIMWTVVLVVSMFSKDGEA